MKFENAKPISQIRKEQESDPVMTLGRELASLKLGNIEKEATIQTLGQELALAKLEIIQLKGGGA